MFMWLVNQLSLWPLRQGLSTLVSVLALANNTERERERERDRERERERQRERETDSWLIIQTFWYFLPCDEMNDFV